MSELTRLFVAEACGTATLILLGDGVVAGVLLKKSKAENAGWIVITAGWGLAVMCGIFVSKSLGGPGALNPVGPIADVIVSGKPINDMAALVGGEFLGAFVGAILVFIHYLPHWSATSDPGLKLAVFCTGPAIRSTVPNFLSEFIGTFSLVFIAVAIGNAKIGSGLEPPVVGGLEPPVIGGLIWAIGLGLGGTTGYAINPARDLSPRIAHFLLPIPGKGGSDWGYAWIPVLGPICGGVLAMWVANMLAK